MKRPLLAAFVLGLVMVCAAAEVSYADDPPAVDENGDLIVEPEKPPDPLGNLKLIASYALTALACGVIGFAVIRTFASNMSYPQQKMMLVNFLRTNPYQLMVIGKKSEGTIAEPIIAALKIGGQMGPIDPKIIAQATLPTYDATGKGMVTRFDTIFTKCKLAATAALGGAIIGLTAGRPLPVILGALAGLGFARLWFFRQALESNVLRARAEILPEVDAAVALGRYHTPPAPQA